MARVYFKYTGRGMVGQIAQSDALGDQLEDISEPAWSYLNDDPNEFFRKTLRRRRFHTTGRLGRVSIQMGAQETIGRRVQAVRGVFSRALGFAGLK